MKILFTGAALITLLSLSITATAQKIRLTEGDMSVLKTETSINFQFTYNNMAVGKYSDEADYVARKKEDYNNKEPGRGDTWAKAWVDDRQFRFEPKFVELFIKYSNMSLNKGAKYTIIFNTYFTEPGFNIVLAREKSRVSGTATIIETANPTKVVAVIDVERAPGRNFGGYDYDTGLRLEEAYAGAGKALAKFIKDK